MNLETANGPWPRHLSKYARELLSSTPFNTGTWQSMDVSRSKYHETYEIEDAFLQVANVSPVKEVWQAIIRPDLPWAEDHFEERVSRLPLNPPPSSAYWPHAVRGNADHLTDGVFDHSYPERFWPKHAGNDYPTTYDISKNDPHKGIRFAYGDLDDVVNLLVRNPLTRQAYLPVWFPEDTGACAENSVGPIRVPCTLGYHFMIRPNANDKPRLSCRYYMRSCDLVRHFTNDVYLAGRLMQWVCDEINERTYASFDETTSDGVAAANVYEDVTPGSLIMHISSLHAFVADQKKLEAMANVD